ncbi:Uncharacterized protein Rs2_09281 [Raphanus sativus]|nr:Uncharacterized protein Rs2_09281 [Raphanus sativus]
MRNCLNLQEKEVLELCNSLIKGNFKSIRHIDVSNKRGLVSDNGQRSYKPKFPLEKLKEERSDVTLVADFPAAPWSVKKYPVCHEEDDEELREIDEKPRAQIFQVSTISPFLSVCDNQVPVIKTIHKHTISKKTNKY